jgi:hypothetical protein
MQIENSFYKTPCCNLSKHHHHHREGQRAREAERGDERDTVLSSRRGDMGGDDLNEGIIYWSYVSCYC